MGSQPCSIWKWAGLAIFLVFPASASPDKGMPGYLKALHRLMPGWTIEGDLDVGVSMPLRWRGKDRPAGEVRISFRNGAFSDPDGVLLGERLAGVLRLRSLALQDVQMPVEVELILSRGEFLLEKYYFQIGESPLKLECTGEWDSKRRSVSDLTGVLEWGDHVQAYWNGSLENLGRRMRGVIQADIHLPFHDRWFQSLVVQPRLSIQPEWEKSHLEGSSHGELAIVLGEEDVRVRGRLHLAGTHLALPMQGVSIKGAAGEIPFDIPLSGRVTNAEEDRAPEVGELSIQEASFGKIHWGNLRLQLKAALNRFELIEPLVLPLFGGELVALNVQVPKLMPLPPEFTTDLSVHGLEMRDLSRALFPYRIDGLIEGDLGEVFLESGDMETSGQIHADIWGGRIRLMNIWAENVFSKTRRWGLDADIRNLNLEEATRDIPFGQMGGMLEGEVRDLSFSFGQPESFELWLRSARKSGLDQYIDAKAVKSLSILSSGVSAPLLPWFQKYPFSKLGIYCKLRNDVFTLRGTIVEGDREYLIKRSFLRGINVINRNPNNRITWKDMIQRLRRITLDEGEEVRVETGA